MAVGAQQGFALDAVDNEDFRLAVQLPVGGESRAPRADHAGVPDLLDQAHGVR